ncbi:unnamed protein product [Porites lobata]|uniref:Uncharacterized protein n=1 Tax=Porites lobata TaxID=104759 RepID=A0ABN8Q504_9CNID|nr:unnamed protein product [Porites lobata]
MKRKIDLVEEEHESEHEESESSGDESEDEEPRIKDVLSHLSRAVSEKRASDLLHSMAASKDILFWTPSGQLLRNKRTIPVTNIAELVEYVLLPHNSEVTKPRALNTFLDGLAELGMDKGLIKNKKLLSDLIEKEKGYRNVENTSDNESNNEESSSDIENQEEEEEEVASENGVETEGTQESDNDTENDSEETESSSPETSTTFHSKSPCEHCENSNVYSTLIMKCPKCFWHDNYKICPICDHQIPEERKYIKEGFLRCHDCGLIFHKNAKTLETNFYSPSKEENEEDD